MTEIWTFAREVISRWTILVRKRCKYIFYCFEMLNVVAFDKFQSIVNFLQVEISRWSTRKFFVSAIFFNRKRKICTRHFSSHFQFHINCVEEVNSAMIVSFAILFNRFVLFCCLILQNGNSKNSFSIFPPLYLPTRFYNFIKSKATIILRC